MSHHDTEKRLALEIRSCKLKLRAMRRANDDPDTILLVIAELEELTEKYNRLSDTVYIEKIEDIANDFCDEFYYELEKDTRDEASLSKFYDLDAVLTVIGNDKYNGKLAIVKSIMDKFRDLRIEQTIEKISVDRSQSRHAAIRFDCESLIKINDDKPRKILQMLDIAKSTLPSTYPYVIQREIFLVKDARPLYHWPEKPLEPKKYDNWEPQFKPKVVDRPKSATVPVVTAVELADPHSGEDDDGDDAEGDEDGEVEGEEGSVEAGNGGEVVPSTPPEEQAVDNDPAAEEETTEAQYGGTGDNYEQDAEQQYEAGEYVGNVGVVPDS